MCSGLLGYGRSMQASASFAKRPAVAASSSDAPLFAARRYGGERENSRKEFDRSPLILLSRLRRDLLERLRHFRRHVRERRDRGHHAVERRGHDLVERVVGGVVVVEVARAILPNRKDRDAGLAAAARRRCRPILGEAPLPLPSARESRQSRGSGAPPWAPRSRRTRSGRPSRCPPRARRRAARSRNREPADTLSRRPGRAPRWRRGRLEPCGAAAAGARRSDAPLR